MADKRDLLLNVKVDTDSDSLRQLGNDAERAEDGFDDLNRGLKKLDTQIDETTRRTQDLRKEISKSGDLGLVKDLQRAERDLKKLGRDRKSILGDLQVDSADFDVAPKLVTQLVGRLGPLVARAPLGPVGAAVGAAIVAGAVPVIAGGLGAAFIGGAGGAGIVGGIVLAARDPRVKSAAGELKTFIGKELEFAARPMVPAVLRSLDEIRKGFGPIRDDLADIFEESPKLLAPLTDGALLGVSRIVDGIKDVVTSADGAGPVFAEIGRVISSVGDAIGDVFEQLSDNGDEAAGALRLLGNVIVGAVHFIGDFIEVGSEAFRVMLDIAIGAQNVTEAFVGWVPFFGDKVTQGRDNLLDIKAAMDRTGATFEEGADSAQDLGVGIGSVSDAARAAADGAKLLDQSIRDLIGTQLSMDEANLAVKQGFADLNAALKDGKRTLDDNTQAGRDNRSAILDHIGVLEDARQAQIDNGVEVGTANKRFNDGVAAIQRNAEKLGFNKREVEKLIGAYKNIPGDVSTDVHANTKSATNTVNNFVTKLNRLDGTTVTTYVKTVDLGGGAFRASSSGGGGRSIEPRAVGGPVKKGEPYIVGEKRPELFVPDSNGVIVPNLNDIKASNRPSVGLGGTTVVNYVTVQAGYIATPAQLQAQIAKTVNTLIRKGRVDAVA